ncbi:hypothetical protein L1987_21191 [Smallanthus sonchifolius]|uniref:Uncharacterized protein n=1 Tax=Smallanthus sonchifolius TaxID=185202 RepID=A0ACB9IWT4_9ASTR|nr:hypothetical protein L1987_21191 [Smallanthus sonchifolius]
MSSYLSSRACGFDLEHMVKCPCSNSSTTTSNSSSPSSTLSESSHSPIAISTQKPRTLRKRPNQTYNEASALLSMASPNIFKIKYLSRRTNNLLPKFNEPPELISRFPVTGKFLLRHRPCSLTGLKITNSCQNAGEMKSIDDFDTESILIDGNEQGIDSIMGDCKPISQNHESNDNICYGYPMGLGFRVRNGVRALKNADDRNWWNIPMVDVGNSSPEAIGKCEKSPAGKKKKKAEEFRQGNFNSGDGQRLGLKLDYDGVLDDWADRGLPLPEEMWPSSSPGGDIHAMAANIDLFSDDGNLRQRPHGQKSS